MQILPLMYNGVEQLTKGKAMAGLGLSWLEWGTDEEGESTMTIIEDYIWGIWYS